jgi:cytochrome P450
LIDNRAIDAAIVEPATYAGEEAYEAVFKPLRQEDPVHWATPNGVRPFWAVTKHADIIDIERHDEIFLHGPAGRMMTPAERAALMSIPGNMSMRQTLVSMDGARHRTYRRLTQNWFVPKSIDLLKKDIADLAQAGLDRMIALGDECDFVADVANLFPLRVIMRILGVPPEDEAFFLALSRRIFAPTDLDPGADSPAASIPVAAPDLSTCFAELTVNRRRCPQDDLASLIANSEIGGRPIPDAAASAYYLLIGLGGHPTTASAMAGGLLALLQNPDQMTKLRQNADVIGGAMHEIIRFVSPVKHLLRTATKEYVLRGRRLRPNDVLMLCYPSANRDEDVFPEPAQFRIDRPDNRHLAFGYGSHVCLGKHLAVLELQIFFEMLLKTFEHIELAGEPVWMRSSFAGGLKRLPIRYRNWAGHR